MYHRGLLHGPLMRGKAPARPGSIALKFADYLIKPKLPVLPDTFGHITNTPPPGGWGMMGNDTSGDCVMAGGIHETIAVHSVTGKPVPVFNTACALKNYSMALQAQGGRPYDPNDPATDQGLDMQLAAKWRRDHGIADANGNTHKISAYAEISTVTELMYATYFFGFAGLGIALPPTAEDQFSNGHVWDDVNSQPADPHYVSCVGRNAHGNIVVVTWGDLQGVTPPYVERYMDEAVAYLTTDYLLSSGKTPEGFDMAALQADLAAVTSA